MRNDFNLNRTQKLPFLNNAYLWDEELEMTPIEIQPKKSASAKTKAWDRSLLSHSLLFEPDIFEYELPVFNLKHMRRLTNDFGIIRFADHTHPNLRSGYTLDDNAAALIATCRHYELKRSETDLSYIRIYFNFIKHCLQPEGYFLNYVDAGRKFTEQNNTTNLADSNGKAIWALGYLLSKNAILPAELVEDATEVMQQALVRVDNLHSTRAIAFAINGLYHYSLVSRSSHNTAHIKILANRLVEMYRHESEEGWEWFEGYLANASSMLPQALLCAGLATGEVVYKEIAQISFNFLLDNIFYGDKVRVISAKSWLHKSETTVRHTEQPVDVMYTVLALGAFYDTFKDAAYLRKMEIAFNWFLGNNHLGEAVYNEETGGCHDCLHESAINPDQGAESTISFLFARSIVEKYLPKQISALDTVVN